MSPCQNECSSETIHLKMCSAYRFGILMQIKLMYELKLETEAQGNSQTAYCTCIVPEQLVSTYHISPRVLI